MLKKEKFPKMNKIKEIMNKIKERINYGGTR